MSHAVAAVFFAIEEDGKVCFRMFRYHRKNPGAPYMATRFPVETGEDRETPAETLTACVRHEVACSPDEPFEFAHHPRVEFNQAPIPFLHLAVPADNLDEGQHFKVAFLVTHKGGRVRDCQKTEPGKQKPDGSRKPDEILYPVENLFVEEIIERTTERQPPPFHRIILARAVRRLMEENRDVALRYSRFDTQNQGAGYFASDDELVAKFFSRRKR